jgi:hypothetical protein
LAAELNEILSNADERIVKAQYQAMLTRQKKSETFEFESVTIAIRVFVERSSDGYRFDLGQSSNDSIAC